MDMSFDVQTHGFFDFESVTPENNMEVFWTSNGGGEIGESMTFDSNKNDFVKEFNKKSCKKKASSETKNAAALKSHCEAERRRRERINGHLANLRNFVPSTLNNKMDKATLLSEVIRQVKELKQEALEATKGLLIPSDADEVVVVPYDDNHASNDDVFMFRASVCSEYKPEIIPNLRRVIKELKLNIDKAEISTLGSRVKNVFTISGKKEEIGFDKREKFAKCIHKAMSCALEKISSLEEYSPRATYPSKRRRVSFLETSTFSST
ncbi:hypothetical protein RND81_07G150800 [Saponaria officinalis]|uniref:BHLH domain-containing protein n=1 Tax=Saponaria officinalis TaxID=3572 RepID=A0AAW1JRK2_SAPOF